MAGGRPRKELTDKEFQQLVAMMRIHCTQDEICGVLDMTAETLNTRLEERGEISFSTLLKKHSAEGKASLRRMQWKNAEAGNVTMQIWLGKNELGQTDKIVNEHTGAGGGPIQTEEVTARDRIASRLSRLAAAESTEGDTGGTE